MRSAGAATSIRPNLSKDEKAMKYVFAFRSRNCALRFYDALKREGINSRITGAPRSGGSCALGVEVGENDFKRAHMIVSSPYAFPNFIRVFEMR